MVCRLYIVFCQLDAHELGTGDYSLLTIAEDASQAIGLWREYYANGVNAMDDEEEKYLKSQWMAADPDTVILIPEDELLIRAPRALCWSKLKSQYP